MGAVNVLSHPLILDKLASMRDKGTSCADFRRLLHEITLLMGYEVTADLPTKTIAIETPVATAEFPVLADRALTIVPILRAGLGMVDGLLELLPYGAVLAVVLGISRAGAYELARSDDFPALRIGNRIVVPKEKFIRWIDSQVN